MILSAVSATAVESTAASVETTAAKSAGAAKASNPTTNVVRMRDGPRDATAGAVARMVPRSEITMVADTTVPIATVSVSPVTVAKIRSSKCEPWGVEAPAERVEEDAIVGDERISVKPRVPIPSVTGPEARRPARASRVRAGRINIRLRQIRRPQAGPPVEIVRIRLFVKLPFLQLSGGVECGLVSTLHLNVPARRLDLGLSVKHSDYAEICIKVILSWLP